MIHSLVIRHQRTIAFIFLTLFYCDTVAAAYVPFRQPPIYTPYTYPGAATGRLQPLEKLIATGEEKEPQGISKHSEVADFMLGDVFNTGFQNEAYEPFTGGPGQPEMQSFQSVNSNNMVDLFSGDFSYNIPLMDVGGYPVNLAYRSGVSMDQEASWVGLGWNINPGTINRNLRGVPDDFNGNTDTISKIVKIKENKTTGVTAGFGAEIFGLPLNVGVTGGLFYNTYKGYGLETGINASIAASLSSHGSLTSGLSLNNNSQEGITISPSLSFSYTQKDEDIKSGATGSLSTGLSYSGRSGLKALQISAGYRQYKADSKNQKYSITESLSNFPTGNISFALPSYNPTMTVAYTSKMATFSGKIGSETIGFHPNAHISGYISSQTIEDEDTLLRAPSYGYLHYQNGVRNPGALLDFNRERDMPYREKPEVPHIGLPSYTYDVFSMTGEGTGGMFRPYRGDIGYIYDHFMRSRDASDAASADFGIGLYGHAGLDIAINRSYTQTEPWTRNNAMGDMVKFRSNDTTYEAVYLRNPGEMAINDKSYFETLGGDDVVAVQLLQNGINDKNIRTAASLNLYRNKRYVGNSVLNSTNVVKQVRDKRSQAISYLNAEEASLVGFNKTIQHYSVNKWAVSTCDTEVPAVAGDGDGLKGYYYNNEVVNGNSILRTDTTVDFEWFTRNQLPPGVQQNKFSIQWQGYLKAPVTGTYTIRTYTDDGAKLFLNGRNFIYDWTTHPAKYNDAEVNLVEGQMVQITLDYYEHKGPATVKLFWHRPGMAPGTEEIIPKKYLYTKNTEPDPFIVNSALTVEKRVNNFRKAGHISEIDVVNADGRRYIYGIPVYNFKQKEVTFSVDKSKADTTAGTVGYNLEDASAKGNTLGQDNYYSAEITPAYAHSFLLTSILSPDYVDITGDGISDDDIGDAVKFNYSKVCGESNPFKWRTPYTDAPKKAGYNEGLKSYNRDDRGNYVYGEKELWYLNSIQSKNMIAIFILDNEARKDLYPMNEHGQKLFSNNPSKRLKEIRLYSKPEFILKDTNAVPVKTVHFQYSYELCKGINKQINDTTGKLTLKKVWFTYNGSKKGPENPYVFSYSDNNPGYDARSYDRWGNYKASTQNPDNMSNAEYPYAKQPGYSSYITDSTTIAANAAAWNLDSIVLPSGGRIKIEYESDDYAYVQNRRAMQMFTIVGLGKNNNQVTSSLYSAGDNLYVFAHVNKPVANANEVYEQYIQGIDSVYFRLAVNMKADIWGSGYENVPCYASIDRTGEFYGVKDANTIWFKIKGVNRMADEPGDESPLAKAAIQFLRLNLPSKAYPFSEIGDNLSLTATIKMMASIAPNIKEAVSGYESVARDKGYASTINTSRSIVRLNNPDYHKMGGGHRVKRIKIYDNWKKQTGQKESVYGQEYFYTTVKEINGKQTTISSGVASYEPMIGGEENPFRVPIQYKTQAAVLAPVTLGYTEEPLGESFFPSASVGYSRVRVKAINTGNRRSASGYEETSFYTTYDFPTYTDRSMLDNNTKKRFKPRISNFLRINAKHYLAITQGFKIELNDMNGKVRSQATYPETDSVGYISYTENFYKVDNPQSPSKRLVNTVWTMNPAGMVDTASVIGKEIELMMDMRQQTTSSYGVNFSPNADIFPLILGAPFSYFSLIPMPQWEENKYMAAATTKVIQRYGILDSLIHTEKGSTVSTKNLLYDSETGSVLLTRTQNEFNDAVYNFSYPAHWAYDGMGGAYKNLGAEFKNIKMRNGRIIGGMAPGRDTVFFTGGDELMVASREGTGPEVSCNYPIATFPSYSKIWAVDTSVTGSGKKRIYFVDKDGEPFSGDSIIMKIIRSGRRNINTSAGTVAMLKNPLIKSGSNYVLTLNDSSKVLNTSATEFSQLWHVAERKRSYNGDTTCIAYSVNCNSGNTCNCNCLGKLFAYLQTSGRLFIKQSQNITVQSLVTDANVAGAGININDCPVLKENGLKLFYALTTDSVAVQYRAAIGTCTIAWNSLTGNPVSFYTLHKKDSCTDNNVYWDTHNGSGSVTYQILQTGITGTQQPISADVLTNGNIVVAGGNTNTRSNANGSAIGSATVMVFNQYGVNIWSRSLGINNSLSINVKALSDGGFILCGNKRENTSPEVWSVFLVRFNSSLGVSWAKNYSFNMSDSSYNQTDDLYPSQLIALTDGGFAVTGTKPPIGGIGNSFILRVNSSGNLVWAKSYDVDNNSDGMSSIIQKGDTLISAGFGIINGVHNPYDFFLSKIRLDDGSVIYQKTYDVESSTFNKPKNKNWATRLYHAPNGGYYLTYVNTDTYVPNFGGYDTTAVTGVIKLDDSLKIISSRDFQYGANPLKHLSDAIVTKDGKMVIATRRTAGNSDSWLHKIDVETGTVLWNRRYQHSGDTNRLFSLAEQQDGSLFAAGAHEASGNSEVFVMHVNANGLLPDGSCDSVAADALQLTNAVYVKSCEASDFFAAYPTSLMSDSMRTMLAFRANKNVQNLSIEHCKKWTPTSLTGTVTTQALNLTVLTPNQVYTCGFYNDTATIAKLFVESCANCSGVNGCISAITDTAVNPYRAGLLGNYRPSRGYVYYVDRLNLNPNNATDTRNDGIFASYAPFWSFSGNRLIKSADTAFWVWNSETTMFNQKGFELENKDPLGRYNAGLYGYNLTLPVAVAQNSQYRQSSFEGFEDYKYNTRVCDTTCSVSYRQTDYSVWADQIDSSQHHTGRYSLRIGTANSNIALGYPLTPTTAVRKSPKLRYRLKKTACVSDSLLDGIRTDSSALLAGFSPSAGDSIIVSGWVKEGQDCLCSTYVNNKVVVFYTKANGSVTTDTVRTTGNIVEGWQKFEKALLIPADAVQIVFELQTDKTYTTYFDDLRILPFNANMKSFVYDPLNLRLMAELDENNYATFYEYDDDGTLIRLKKETERGIKTIRETRSSLTKRSEQ